MRGSSLVIATALYFDAPRSHLWAQASLQFVKKIAGRLGVSFSRFGVEPLERQEGDLRGNHSYEWSPKNVEKLEAMVSKRRLESLEVEFVEDPGTDHITHGPFVFSVRFNPTSMPPGIAYLHLSVKLAEGLNDTLSKAFCDVIRRLNEIADIRYGFVQPMSLDKAPYVFVVGAAGPSSTHLERKDNALWRRFVGDYRRQMRNLYWGNLVTREHFLLPFENALERISDVVSAKNVFVLENGKAFFVLPIELRDIENRDDCGPYHAIRTALKPYLRFMIPDEWVMKASSGPNLGEIMKAAEGQSRGTEPEEKPN